MSNDKLAEALRNARSFVSLFHDDPAQACLDEIDAALQAHAAEAGQPRSCTCHPDDNPPVPCPQKFAYSECVKAAQPQAAEPVTIPAAHSEVLRTAQPAQDAKGPNLLATGPTKWRAEQCVTHHHACDCREWEHASQIAALGAVLEVALSIMDANDPLNAARLRKMRDAAMAKESGNG